MGLKYFVVEPIIYEDKFIALPFFFTFVIIFLGVTNAFRVKR